MGMIQSGSIPYVTRVTNKNFASDPRIASIQFYQIKNMCAYDHLKVICVCAGML